MLTPLRNTNFIVPQFRKPHWCTFVLCLIGRPKAHNKGTTQPNVGLGRLAKYVCRAWASSQAHGPAKHNPFN
jgi:hypothetical protein